MVAALQAQDTHLSPERLSLSGQFLFLLCLVGVCFREQKHLAPDCKTVLLWISSFCLLLGVLVCLQGAQLSRERKERNRWDAAFRAAKKLLIPAMLLNSFIGIGVHTHCGRCSTSNPLLWWSGFLVSCFFLLFSTSRLFLFFSALYFRKFLLRRGLHGVCVSTDGEEGLSENVFFKSGNEYGAAAAAAPFAVYAPV